jgi:hypothetical protein
MEVHVVNGDTSEDLETETNITGTMDTIITLQPERGTWVRILNSIARGDLTGVPLYMDLVDQNGNPMPANTELQFAASEAGMTQSFKVSEMGADLSSWNNHSIKEQRHRDNVDAVKVHLEYPENHPQDGVRDQLDITDTDTFHVQVNSPAQWDPSASRFYIDSNAVTKY